MRLQFHKCLEFLGSAPVFGMSRVLSLLGLLVWGCQALAQTFVYVEPDNPSCPVIAQPPPSAPQTVRSGVSVAGALKVGCGFSEGSYTVILNATDPNASFSPKSFLVNFGSLVGTGVFAVKFSTAGEQTISANITSNMGSPPLRGKFTSFTNVVTVVRP